MKQPYVAIKSYKRAGQVKTIQIVPFAYIWVPESQGDQYRSFYGDRVVTIPDQEDGNICKKFNAILDRSPSEWTLILDDDISLIGYFENGRRFRPQPDYLLDWFTRSFSLAEELGVHLWGINQNDDPMAYRTCTPLSLLAPILGPFNGHIKPILRYDPLMDAKEDYDFWLQNIREYHKTLRFNKWHYRHDHGAQKGGLVSMRTLESEQTRIQRMQVKWGSKVYRPGGSAGPTATGKNLLNSLVKVPIQGT